MLFLCHLVAALDDYSLLQGHFLGSTVLFRQGKCWTSDLHYYTSSQHSKVGRYPISTYRSYPRLQKVSRNRMSKTPSCTSSEQKAASEQQEVSISLSSYTLPSSLWPGRADGIILLWLNTHHLTQFPHVKWKGHSKMCLESLAHY